MVNDAKIIARYSAEYVLDGSFKISRQVKNFTWNNTIDLHIRFINRQVDRFFAFTAYILSILYSY